MSMHKKPLTAIEESGLRSHGLDIGTPSQLSDVFRQGVAWALSQAKGDPVGSFDKHMEYMQRNIELEKEITQLKAAKAELYESFSDAVTDAKCFLATDGGWRQYGNKCDSIANGYDDMLRKHKACPEGAPYKQHPDIIGYARKIDLAPLLDRAQPDGSYITIGLDHPSCWEEEPPYDHLVPLYMHPEPSDNVVMTKEKAAAVDAAYVELQQLLYKERDERDAELARLRAQINVWVDCNVRMPEREVEVLVKYIPNGKNDPIVVAALRDYMFPEDERLFWWNSRGEAMGGKVISWMVMPV